MRVSRLPGARAKGRGGRVDALARARGRRGRGRGRRSPPWQHARAGGERRRARGVAEHLGPAPNRARSMCSVPTWLWRSSQCDLGAALERRARPLRIALEPEARVGGEIGESLLRGLARNAEVLADLGPRVPGSAAHVDEVVQERVAEVVERRGGARGRLELDERVRRGALHVADEGVEGEFHAVNLRLTFRGVNQKLTCPPSRPNASTPRCHWARRRSRPGDRRGRERGVLLPRARGLRR